MIGGELPVVQQQPGLEVVDPNIPGDAAKNTENNLGKVFVGGLAPTTNGDALKEYFNGAYGNVKDAYVNTTKDEYTGQIRSRGFGFVIFENPSCVEEVVQLSKTTEIVIDGRKVEVKPVDENEQQRKAEIEARQIFVGGLPESCTNEMLLNCFKNVDPEVTDAKVRMDPFTNRSRGFGYVTFSDKRYVEVATSSRDSHYIDGKWVDVKACIPMHKDNKVARGNNFGMGQQQQKGKKGNMMGKGMIQPGWPAMAGKMGGFGMKGGFGKPMMGGFPGAWGGPMQKGGWAGPQMGGAGMQGMNGGYGMQGGGMAPQMQMQNQMQMQQMQMGAMGGGGMPGQNQFGGMGY